MTSIMMGRTLTESEHVIAEQGLLNLALQTDIQILLNGRDVTLSLIEQAARVNKAYDALHPKPAPKKQAPRARKVQRKTSITTS